MQNEIAKLIDHTFLKPAGEKDAIEKLCREAKEFGFATVCVNPAEVRTAARLLKGSSVKVCTVIDFPLGQSSTMSRILQATRAIDDGAKELDLVINQRLLKYDPEACIKDLKTFASVIEKPIVTKLILECCNLTEDEIIDACYMARDAGFDFVKTSTGFGSGGATVEDVKLMRKIVGDVMGVKAAGGIRDKETALRMIEAGADRIGTSCGVKLVS